jgi:calcium channel MID1
MYNLSFCSEVAYAVPSNPNLFSPATGLQELAGLYDNNAKQMYQYFNYSLQQIPCNTTSSAQYSLARTCDDCARAYKQWLCAVTIPRCADFSDPSSFLMPRNVGQKFINGSSISSDPSLSAPQAQTLLDAVATNSSRNPVIDSSIRPGPYKEVLPCEDLCYDLVQSCPAALGFACPLAGKGLEESYGKRVNQSEGVISCSYLGAAFYLSGSSIVAPSLSVFGMVCLAFTVGLML